jgi:hypothetical protein
MLRSLKWLALVGLMAVTGCSPSEVGEAAKPAPSCKDEVGNMKGSFRPLPAGLEYGVLPKKELAADRRGMSDVAIAYDERYVKGVGAVTVTVFKAPFGPADEEAFKRGLAQEAGMPDEKWQDMDLGPVTVTYVHTDEQGIYARTYASGCRAVLVAGRDDELTRRVARAVLGG